MKIKSYKIVEVGEPDITLKYAEDTFNELLAFQGYGFCLGYDTVVELPNNKFKLLGELLVGDKIKAPNGKFVNVIKILPNGEKDAFFVELENGKTIKSTLEHLFLCSDGERHTLYEIIEKKMEIVCED